MPKNFLSIIEYIITSPLLSWTWSGLSDPKYISSLVEFRPIDKEAARDITGGRYLLAGKLIDTQSTSPFSILEADEQWIKRLNDFSWLRHFSSFVDIEEKEFARILVLDWIGQNKNFNKNSWAPVITSLRILNWLRHFSLLKEGASEKEIKIISHSLSTQVQSLRIRFKFMQSPIDKIYSAMALFASALAKKSNKKIIVFCLLRLQILLDKQIDADGLHLSRNALFQFEILSELTSLKQTLIKSDIVPQVHLDKFSQTLDKMYFALDNLTLGTGELAYFNGARHIPTDLFVALMAKGSKTLKKNRILSGYGILVSGNSIIIADSGVVPKITFTENAHASALSFEFSHGSDLIIGNCGVVPIPALGGITRTNNDYYRLGKAHNGIIINDCSSAKIAKRGFFAGHLKPNKKPAKFKDIKLINFDEKQETMSLESYDFAKKHGVKLKRSFSYLKNEATLVGIDEISFINDKPNFAEIELGFHLSPNIQISKNPENDFFDIILHSGAEWVFLWEGAEAYLEKSYRHSNYLGALPIYKIVLKSHFEKSDNKDKKISWIFTKQK